MRYCSGSGSRLLTKLTRRLNSGSLLNACLLFCPDLGARPLWLILYGRSLLADQFWPIGGCGTPSL
jgi:hypothetical protein